jgi:hypothetical protein
MVSTVAVMDLSYRYGMIERDTGSEDTLMDSLCVMTDRTQTYYTSAPGLEVTHSSVTYSQSIYRRN